eukprot:7940153-Ditylum_brightwellii.AAC.1
MEKVTGGAIHFWSLEDCYGGVPLFCVPANRWVDLSWKDERELCRLHSSKPILAESTGKRISGLLCNLLG